MNTAWHPRQVAPPIIHILDATEGRVPDGETARDARSALTDGLYPDGRSS